MAETPGKDTPPTDPKSATRPGPVKPPVLEGTARPASSDKPAETRPESPKPEPAKPTPRPAAKPERDDVGGAGGAPWLAGILGGLIGLGAAYGLAYFGAWPTGPVEPQPADPRIAEHSTVIPELQTVTGTIQDELATLNGRVSSIEAEQGAAASAPAASPETEAALADLAARVDALAAQPAASADDGSSARNADAIATLETQLEELRQLSAQTQAQLAEAQERIASLTTTTSEAAAANDGAAQLPLIFSGLEIAFSTGRPFEAELSALRTALPQAGIPESLSARAASGLPRPDSVKQRLAEVLPDMLAQRPLGTDGDWQQSTLDWVRGVVAMRPTGEVEGDSPDAIIARFEAAVGRGDFTAAQAELAALPEPMRAPAAALGDDIAALAEAGAFLSSLRNVALGAEPGA